MSLGSPTMLATLALIPAAAIAWWWLWRARRLHQQDVGAEVAGVRRGVGAARALLLLTLAALAVAASRPMWNAGEQTLGLSDFSLVVALDVSQSMAAEDVAGGLGEPVSRFTAAKSEVRRLIDGRRGDRVGLVLYAGNAFLRFPLTRDHEAALQVLEALQPGEALVTPGSNIASGIELATATILRAAEEDGTGVVNGAIAVVGDGETHAGSAESAAAAAHAQGLQVFAVGVGSQRGATIPLGQNAEPKRNPTTGAPIITRLDEQHLERIASAGDGRYIQLDRPGAMASMSADLAALDLVRGVVVEETALAEQFQWFAGAAAFLLVLSVAARVIAWSPGKRLGLASVGALATSLLVAGGCSGPSVEQANRDGVAHYEAGEYAEALESWRSAQRLAQRSDAAADPRLHLNVGRALHQLGEFERAETETLSALRSEDAAIRARAWFHAGNHRWSNNDLLGARQAFIEALRETPSLIDAKINLEIINALLTPPEQDDAAQEPDSEQGSEQSSQQDSQQGGQQRGQPGDPSSAGEPAEQSDEPDASQTGQEGEGSPGENQETPATGQGAGAQPLTPSFSDEQSLPERRAEAIQELQAALDELPLENASLEQALAVLDALRAVPGERLAAGRLQSQGQDLDW